MPTKLFPYESRRSVLPTFLAIVVIAVGAGVAGTLFVLPYATSLVADKAAVSGVELGALRNRQNAALPLGTLTPASRASVSFAGLKPTTADVLASSYVPGDAFAMGVVVTSDGWLATVDDPANAKRLRVGTSVALVGGKAYRVTRTVVDSYSGVTFAKVDAENLPVAAFGSSDALAVGDPLFAVDPAAGLHRSEVLANDTQPAALSADALRSSEQAQRIVRLAGVQGAAGTMLLDAKGEIVGLLSGVGPFGANMIPIEAFSDVIGTVLRGQTPERALLGVHYVDLSLLAGRAEGLPARGALLASSADLKKLAVVRGTPAATAALRAGDVIVSIDGEQISAKNPLGDALAEYAPGDVVTLAVLRGKSPTTIDVVVTLGTVPAK